MLLRAGEIEKDENCGDEDEHADKALLAGALMLLPGAVWPLKCLVFYWIQSFDPVVDFADECAVEAPKRCDLIHWG
jgi:hypothetical protein